MSHLFLFLRLLETLKVKSIATNLYELLIPIWSFPLTLSIFPHSLKTNLSKLFLILTWGNSFPSLTTNIEVSFYQFHHSALALLSPFLINLKLTPSHIEINLSNSFAFPTILSSILRFPITKFLSPTLVSILTLMLSAAIILQSWCSVIHSEWLLFLP